jgi:hypothetical protein
MNPELRKELDYLLGENQETKPEKGLKSIQYGVFESLVRKIKSVRPEEIHVEKHFAGELPDGNEVWKYKTYHTHVGEVEIELEHKLSFDYYAEEEHAEITLTLYSGGKVMDKIVGTEKPKYWSELLEGLVKSMEHKKVPPTINQRDPYQALVSLALG